MKKLTTKNTHNFYVAYFYKTRKTIESFDVLSFSMQAIKLVNYTDFHIMIILYLCVCDRLPYKVFNFFFLIAVFFNNIRSSSFFFMSTYKRKQQQKSVRTHHAY